MKKILSIILLLLMSSQSLAQSGPMVACVDCENLTERPKPRSGTYYNPDQSGTGFNIEIQNNNVLGIYYGFTDEGTPTWGLFSGELQASEEVGKLWEITANLSNFKNGNCINCEYTGPPEADEDLGEIKLVFNQLGHATFSINEGEPQNIVPLYFGIPAQSYFPEQTSFKIPEVEGWWTVFVHFKLEGIPELYSYVSYPIYFIRGHTNQDQGSGFRVSSLYFPNAPESLDVGSLICENVLVDESMQPTCNYTTGILLGPGTHDFKIPIANITANRIFGETENGDVIEMIRNYSDLCLSNNSERCINTTFIPQP